MALSTSCVVYECYSVRYTNLLGTCCLVHVITAVNRLYAAVMLLWSSVWSTSSFSSVFNARWVRWVWLPTWLTILTDGTLDDLVPTPVPAFTYSVPSAMSHLPSSSVRDHMKWVCFDNTKVVRNYITCIHVSLRMLSLLIWCCFKIIIFYGKFACWNWPKCRLARITACFLICCGSIIPYLRLPYWC